MNHHNSNKAILYYYSTISFKFHIDLQAIRTEDGQAMGYGELSHLFKPYFIRMVDDLYPHILFVIMLFNGFYFANLQTKYKHP